MKETFTEYSARKLIGFMSVHNEVLAQNGVRVALNHLNPNGFDEGMNQERETIFDLIIGGYVLAGRFIEASGVREFREVLRKRMYYESYKNEVKK